MIAFSLGSIHIYWYGIFYLITCVLWYAFLWRVGKQQRFKEHTGVQRLLTSWVDDLILATILWVLIGGRLWHVFIYERPYYQNHIMEIFAVWHGGMSFIGGILWVIIAIFVVERMYKLSRKEFFIIFDLLLLVIPIGILLWRVGNYLNQELYGIIVPDSLLWMKDIRITHIYDKIDMHLRFNTNFIAAFFEWLVMRIVLVTLLFKQRWQKKWKPWMITVTFIILYSVMRFALEYLRQDSQFEYIWPMTTTQWFMILFLGFGFILWFFYESE